MNAFKHRLWTTVLIFGLLVLFLTSCQPREEPPIEPYIFPALVHPAISAPFEWLCFEDILEAPIIIEEFFFPIGCEVIDCCPGCPGPGPIDLSFMAGGNLLENIIIEFDPGDMDVDIDPIQLAPGASFELSEIPVAEPGEQPIIAHAKVILDKENIDSILKSPRPELESEIIGSIEFVGTQYDIFGGNIVNEIVYVIFYKWCFEPLLLSEDMIELRSNAGNDNTVVLIDGRNASGCFDDAIYRGEDLVSLSNVLSDGNCNSEISVFSDDDRATFIDSPSPPWTDAVGDTVIAELDNMHAIPVTVWLASTNVNTMTTYQNDAQTHINRAIQVYNDMNSGITFQVTWQQITNNADVNIVETTLQNVITSGLCTTGNITGDPNLFNNNQINIYYAAWTGANGFACGDDFIAMTAATPETLAHEFGHSLDVDHYYASNTNIMWWTGITGRNNFTVGQIFRMNMNSGSCLNTLNVRNGPTRDCPHITISNLCPDIILDTSNK